MILLTKSVCIGRHDHQDIFICFDVHFFKFLFEYSCPLPYSFFFPTWISSRMEFSLDEAYNEARCSKIQKKCNLRKSYRIIMTLQV